ncbi:YhcN/YlaJ family sporulation lipoprotein [Sutcliffiella halmapala]|uniref:YhcN/YlaJ family sporulation lipoprotein n=1 Tax=Sutcliffiella halmapala TaxID=79882 RepID=UPI00147612D8|nr:YhcN/YlaJ family sporulation lipoprotein [Sutcliffiella halmapala]
MKKTLAIIGILGLSASFTTACQFDTTPNERQARSEIVDRQGRALNTKTDNNLYNMYDERDGQNHGQGKFGYVREQASPVKNSQRHNENIAAVDYDEVANVISKMLVQMPNVEDVATLVTDEEVLIAYKTSSENRKEVANQVSKSALSVVPRFYHVYVSDNPRMIAEIERFRMLTVSSPNVDEILENTIDEMLQSPQGNDLTKGENGNGEGKGEKNEDLENEYSEHRKNMRKN